MKKMTALLLALMMVICSCVALAEEESVYANVELPDLEGVSIIESYEDDSYLAAQFVKEGAADVYLVVAPGEEYAGRSLSDLTEDELNELQSVIMSDLNTSTTCTLETTPSGNLYLYIQEKGESYSNTVVTIYRGYFIQLTQFKDDYSELGEADEAFLMDLLHALNIPNGEE